MPKKYCLQLEFRVEMRIYMKRIFVLIEIIIVFFSGLIIGMHYGKNELHLENNLKQITNIGFSNILISKNNEEKIAMEFYEDFLQARITAFSEDIGEIEIADITVPKGEPEKQYYSKYTYLDTDKDGVKELHVKSARYYYIIKYNNNGLYIWKQLSQDWEPLNNGAFLEERTFSAPSYTVYTYNILDCNGNDIFKLNFGTYDKNYNGVQDEDDEYYFDGLKMEKDVWDTLTNKYLSVGNDEIQWIVLYDRTKYNYSL